MKVLVVDASARVRGRVVERFADEGIAVLEAARADDAVRALATEDVAAIVFDLHVAEEPGAEVLVRLRRCAPKATIVVLSDELHELGRSECLRRGADYCFDKAREFERAVEVVVSLTRSS